MKKIAIGEKTIKEMVSAYESGLTHKEVGEKFGLTSGVAYNALKKAGCNFRRRGYREGYKIPREAIERSAEKRRGKPKSKEAVRKMAESKKSHFNGLNGYGHKKKHNSGYVLVYAPEHPFSNKDGYVFEHTVVMERSIGRFLQSFEVVHHINRDKADNSIENLRLMKRHDHMSMHMKERHEKRRIQNGTRR